MAQASKQGGSRVRVLVGDPSPLFRDGLARIVKRRPDFQLVGAVAGHEFLGALDAYRPDVALVDPTELNDEERQEIFGRIRRERLRVIFISDAFAQPFAGVVRDTEGNIYGSTFYGGNSACMFGCGTSFR